MADLAPFERALTDLVCRLDALRMPYMVIGGLAVYVRGVPRTTRDVDVTVLVPRDGLSTLLAALEPAFRPRTRDPMAFVETTHVLPLEGPDGVPVDLTFAMVPFEEEAIERATLERYGGVSARVSTAEDLILMKLVADRLQDRADVEGIVRSGRSALDRATLDPMVSALARDLERPEMEAFYLGLFAKRGSTR